MKGPLGTKALVVVAGLTLLNLPAMLDGFAGVNPVAVAALTGGMAYLWVWILRTIGRIFLRGETPNVA